MKKILLIILMAILLVVYFTSKHSINKNWYSKDKGVDTILSYVITDCTSNDNPSNKTIIDVINHIYKGSPIYDKKDLQTAKCTQQVMEKYDPLLIWKAIITNDSKTTDSFFKDTRKIQKEIEQKY